MSSVVCQSCGANAFRWYDTADQVVECKYCHSKQAFIKGMGVESAIKVVGGKEEAETDSEYQERIIHQFGLKDQVIEVKNYSLIDIPLTFIVWLYLDILLGALFICGGFLSKNYRAWYGNLLRWHFYGWRYTKSATEKEKASQRIRGSLLIKWLLQEVRQNEKINNGWRVHPVHCPVRLHYRKWRCLNEIFIETLSVDRKCFNTK